MGLGFAVGAAAGQTEGGRSFACLVSPAVGLASGVASALSAEEDGLNPPAPSTRAVPGQFVVCVRDGTARGRLDNSVDALGPGIEFVRWLSPSTARVQAQGTAGRGTVFDRLALVIAATNMPAELLLARLRQNPVVAYAEPNTILTLDQNPEPERYPNEFRFGELWSLRDPDAPDGRAGADVRAPQAWAVTTGDAGVRVAVIDTGIDYYHPDLDANVWTNPGEITGNGVDDDGNGWVDDVHGYDFVSDDSDPMDDQIHGTHVAGTIGAVGNNEIGVVGVCWRTALMAVKAFNANGEGTLFDVLGAIRYAVVNGARVLNASWSQSQRSQALAEAIDDAYTRGVVIVASAGNNRSDVPSYPAGYPEAVTVAALSRTDQRSIFSSYGAHVDLAAPGENILSTVPNNGYEWASGTSMAAPHVSGVAALILSRHPEFTPAQVGDVLRNAVDPIRAAEYCGTGRLNAGRAVRVDVPLPTARLELPDVLSARVDLRGTATSDHFSGYALDYGQGVYPTNWTRLHASEAPIDRGPLLEDWATDLLPEGAYVLRLTVWDTFGQEAVERATVTVRNVHLAAPLHGDIVRSGDLVAVRGTVFGVGRTYTLAHGVGRAPTVWSTNGITLVAGGHSQVVDDLLGTWDTGAVAANEFYTLKLTAWAGSEAVGTWSAMLVYLDDRLRPGWPQHVVAPSGYSTNDWRQITAADLDRDGLQEILVVEAGNESGKTARLLVYGLDGRLRWWQDLAAGLPTADVPTVGDIDGDGFGEVFVDAGDTGQVWAFRHDGRPLDGRWPALVGAKNAGKILADLDGDGSLELILCGTSLGSAPAGQRTLAVLDVLGEVRQRWFLADATVSVDVPRQFPSVGDFDDDAELEIVAVSGENQLEMFDLRHPEGPVWRVRGVGSFCGSPVVGDLNGDGWAEIVLGSHDASAGGKAGTRGGIYVFDRRGQAWPGWPVLIDESFPATPALADFDGDGTLEIVAVNWESRLIHLLRHDGFDLPGWPVGPVMASTSTTFPLLGTIKSMPVVGDVDGDGLLEVVLVAPSRGDRAALNGDVSFFGGVKAWSLDGQPTDLHPRPELTSLVTESGHLKAAAPILADLDGDGRLEVVASTVEDRGYGRTFAENVAKRRFSVYVWELGVSCDSAHLPWPMVHRDRGRTGSVPAPKPQNQSPAVAGIPSQTVATGGEFFPIELDRYVEDPDHSTAALTWTVEGASELLVTLGEDRVVRIEPPTPSWAGAETLRFVARDPGGLEAAATATFAVRLDYLAPAAIADHGELDEDTAVDLDVLANDTHPQGLPLLVSQVGRARAGQVDLLSDGRLRYRPAPDFFGQDSFHYMVSDGQDGMAMAWVTLLIRPLPDPPVAAEDRVITFEDTPVAIDVLVNDSDVDGDSLALAGFTQPADGTVAQNADACLVYHPRSGWWGSDTFGYSIADGQGHAAHGVVTLQVKPVNDPPVAHDLSFVLNRNTSQALTYQAADPDNDDLTFEIVQGPDHGELWAQPTVATYHPHHGFAGEDTFTYVASDGEHTSLPAVARFTVLAVNNPPESQPQSLVTKVGRPLNLTLQATDLDADPLSFEVVQEPARGGVAVVGSNAVYTPQPDYLGDDRFAFRASDGQAASPPSLISVRLTDQNTGPSAESYSVVVPMNTPTRIALRATDGENDPLEFMVVTNPVHGAFTGTAPDLTSLLGPITTVRTVSPSPCATANWRALPASSPWRSFIRMSRLSRPTFPLRFGSTRQSPFCWTSQIPIPICFAVSSSRALVPGAFMGSARTSFTVRTPALLATTVLPTGCGMEWLIARWRPCT